MYLRFPSQDPKKNSEKLKKVKEEINGLNKWIFRTGAPKDLKLFECPWCKEQSCYYIGGGPSNVECLNSNCKYYKVPPKESKEAKESEESKKEDDLKDDFNFDKYGFGD
ncbi:MAG: hypothetical protein ACXADW_02825 [Candidatus Hodarchaeales archaeon]|jgi:hypothetical protein